MPRHDPDRAERLSLHRPGNAVCEDGRTKEYVRQKLAEQENDLIAQYPRLEALGANASLTERMLVELASTVDNPAGAVVTLNSLRERILAIKSSTKGGSALPVPEIVIARNGLRYKSNSKHTTGSAGNYKRQELNLRIRLTYLIHQ